MLIIQFLKKILKWFEAFEASGSSKNLFLFFELKKNLIVQFSSMKIS